MENTINYVDWITPNYNLGEEALYAVLRKIFFEHDYGLCRVTDRIKQKHSQINIIGGGSCLPSIIIYMRPTKYMYVFGSGVLDPIFYGYFNHALIDRFKSLSFRFIGVRGNVSKILLKDWGIDSRVIGDPCLSLKPPQILEKSSNRIAINIGDAKAKYSEKNRGDVVRELVKVCKYLKAEGYELIIVPFWKENMEDVASLSEKAQIKVFAEWQNIAATMNLLSSCKIFIGEKLHSLVFSAAANTPFVGLAYAPEHFDFVESVDFSRFTMPITEISAEKILLLFHDLLDNYEKILEKLSSRVNGYREIQRKFAVEIVRDLNCLPDDKWSTQNNYLNTILLRADKQFYIKTGKMWNIWNKTVFSQVLPYLI
jgi:polysaccharide pyruvyl transferase WcaK-like protein